MEAPNSTAMDADTPAAPPSVMEQLCDKHPCLICKGVLAAPCVLECGHSFCGACINKLTMKNGCPVCSTRSHGAYYESHLDKLILAEVEQFPACKLQEEYLQRRNRYLDACKQEQQALAEAKARMPKVDWMDKWVEKWSKVDKGDKGDK